MPSPFAWITQLTFLTLPIRNTRRDNVSCIIFDEELTYTRATFIVDLIENGLAAALIRTVSLT